MGKEGDELIITSGSEQITGRYTPRVVGDTINIPPDAFRINFINVPDRIEKLEETVANLQRQLDELSAAIGKK